MQVCKKCKVERPFSDFKEYKQKGKDYITRTCKPCINRYQRDLRRVDNSLDKQDILARVREACLSCGNVSSTSH